MPRSIKIVLASIIGTMLEFYGFSLYVIFSETIAKHFFPSNQPTLSLLWVYAVFASGFLMRPLGAAIFGYVGDKYGRREALYLSIGLMGMSLFIIGLLPSYRSIGILAPVIIVLCRLLQGACAGGEYNNAGIFAIDHFKERAGLVGSLVACGAGMGALLAIGMKYISQQPSMGEEVWRLPFLAGAAMSFIGIFLRKSIKHLSTINVAQAVSWKFIFYYKSSSLSAFSIGAIDGAFAYTMAGFMGSYLHRFIGLEPSESTQLCMYAFASNLIFAPLIGYMSDLVDKQALFKIVILLILPMTYFTFILITTGNWGLIMVAEIAFAFMYAAISALQHAYLQSLFPAHLRSRGIGVCFSLGGALFGGGAPLILTSLLEIYPNNMIPAYFLILVSLFCLASCMISSDQERSRLATASPL